MAKKKLIISIALTAILIAVFFPRFSKYRKLSLENKRLQQRIEELKEANKRLEGEKYKLEHDIEYVEKRAREKLRIVKKGEIPIRTEEGGKDEQ
ncbi:MAG: septum formation initiator family protein [Candidatus Omnitrophota bacterium]|nr:septum formation initiator family protein [Candidatus Omnitrophota bacterium]